MKNTHKNDIATKKKAYASPNLKQYGSVRLMTQGVGSVNGDGGMGMMVMSSERELKENIVRIGTHPFGIGLYLFNYKSDFRHAFGYGRQFGVMADEVELIMPEAVSVHAEGYKQVDYALLGIVKTIH